MTTSFAFVAQCIYSLAAVNFSFQCEFFILQHETKYFIFFKEYLFKKGFKLGSPRIILKFEGFLPQGKKR